MYEITFIRLLCVDDNLPCATGKEHTLRTLEKTKLSRVCGPPRDKVLGGGGDTERNTAPYTLHLTLLHRLNQECDGKDVYLTEEKNKSIQYFD